MRIASWILGVVAVIVWWGAWMGWHFKPDDPKYAIPVAALRWTDQGFRDYLRDQKRAMSVVLVGSTVKLVAFCPRGARGVMLVPHTGRKGAE